MLSDYTNLAISLKDKFREIDEWPEITFDTRTIDKLSSIQNVRRVNKHSIQFEIDENQVVIPSQYILFAVCIKELALKLSNHLEFFEQFKQGKSTEDVCSAIVNENYNVGSMNLDEYSQSIALSVFKNPRLNMSAKSILNGSPGNYKLRSASDFFSSVILKIINVPDASSAILGKLIYTLSKSPEIYSHLEKTYITELPYVLKSAKIGQFVKSCLEFFIQYTSNDFEFIESTLVQNSESSLFSIKDSEFKLTSIFKKSRSLISEEGLSQGGRPRFFSDPVYIDAEGNFVYLSTEWTYNTNSRLDLSNFAEFIEKKFPMFIVEITNGLYTLKPRSVQLKKNNLPFSIDYLIHDIKGSGLVFKNFLIQRFFASLNTKPFVILTGLSGSGKTKLAQSFTMWISESNEQYALVPVGADWTNREPLLGYPNSLKSQHYVKPDTGVLDILVRAHENYLSNEKDLAKCKPYFLILDEMNLSHVERYFADFLSSMESGDEIRLYSGAERFAEFDKDDCPITNSRIPQRILLPKNLFIIGTVNIDETTYMFSPKVLDRANTIEFRLAHEEMESFYQNAEVLNMNALSALGKDQAFAFMALTAGNNITIDRSEHKDIFLMFFETLQVAGAEFGYRTAEEMTILVSHLLHLGISVDASYDAAIMQKLLPKLHGSRSKLNKIIPPLLALCEREGKIIYPLSHEKLSRMKKNADENGFASYAEA
jgi:5-methylcytosine-specific restriction protein B